MLKTDKQRLINFWQGRIKEIEEKGNCSNGNLAHLEDYFQGRNKKYTPEEMIEYCKKMITKIENYE